MRTGNPGHLKAFDYIGVYRYFLTFCTDTRAALFIAPGVADLVLRQVQRAARDEGMAISAYCFMPDHLHLLIEGLHQSSDCRAFIKRAKQLSGFYYKQQSGRRLWQRYGFEHVLRSDEATLDVARYIIENPVRAGLVASAEDYPFVGSETYTVSQILDAIQIR